VRAAVFLDKDGTLVENRPYNVEPSRMVLMPGAMAGLRALHAHGYPLIVISNQPGVAHGHFPEPALVQVRRHLSETLQDGGVTLSGFYYCPHHPGGRIAPYAVDCKCRKPAPGLLIRAAREHGVDLAASWFVGDILDDIEAGRRAGCRAVLIDNGNETEWKAGPLRRPHHVAPDVEAAARHILRTDVRRARQGMVAG
jgi:D-glycero-D-manno-heptose 1,7-bisphosphate phosphatase